MPLEFDNTRYVSECRLTPDEILAQPDLWMEVPPLWTCLHDLAREGWEMKIHSRGGIQRYNIPSDGHDTKEANWWNGRTTIHVRRANQKNYGIKLTIPGRVYRLEQVWEMLTIRNYTSTLNLTVKCLDATRKGAEDAIREHGWSHLMDARLNMVAADNPDLHEYVRKPEPADLMLGELQSALAKLRARRDAMVDGVVVPFRRAG